MTSWIEKFPWTKVTVCVGVAGIVVFTLIAAVRLALGLVFPTGYEPLLYSLVALASAGGAIAIGKRATDYTLAAIKTGDAQTIASVVGPPKIPDSDAPTPPDAGERGDL
jgi:hypothetical protein